MLNLRTLILGQPRTCPQTGLQNEPRYSEKQSEFGTVNWTPYLINYKNDPLSRSFLVMTGGNKLPKRKKLDNDSDEEF